MPEERTPNLSELQIEVKHLREALWSVLIAVDDLRYIVEMGREEGADTSVVSHALTQARIALGEEEVSRRAVKGQKTRQAG